MNLAKKIRLALPVALATAIAPISAIAEGTLNVYNWGEYIGEETIANFEKEFGIEVTYDNYDSVETADAKFACRQFRLRCCLAFRYSNRSFDTCWHIAGDRQIQTAKLQAHA